MITIVMPVYNGARHLREALASLLQQGAHVVCVDDASTDDSAAIVRACGVELVQNDRRLGLAGNWNRCIDLVTTPFFVLAHQDDVYEPGYAEAMLALIEAHPRAFIAHCKTTSIDDDGRAISTPAARYKESLWPKHDPYEEGGDAGLRRLARGNFIVAPSVVFRAEAASAIGPFSPFAFVTDWEYWLRGLLAGYTIAGTHRRLVRFRRHAATATRALERTLDRYREEIALQRWIESEARIPAQYATVSRIVLSEIAAALAAGDRDRAAELASFGRAEIPRFPAALAALAVRSGKFGGRGLLAAQAVALRFASGRDFHRASPDPPFSPPRPGPTLDLTDAPLISVIVPVYNYERYLAEALDSVLAQTYANWECIVVDDASTDNSAAIAESYAARDKRFRCVHHRVNRGVSAARNRGTNESRGAYVQFLDADDRLLPEKLAKHARFLDEHPECGLVYSEAAYFTDGAPRRLRSSRYGTLSRSIMARVHGSEEAWHKLEHYNICPIQSVLFRSDAVRRGGAFEETTGGFEDWDFLLRCVAAGVRFDFTGGDEPLVAIRAHRRGASSDHVRMMHGLIAAAKAFPARNGLPLIYEVALGIEQVYRGERREGRRRIGNAARRATESLTEKRWRVYALAARVLPRDAFLRFVSMPMPEWPLELVRRLRRRALRRAKDPRGWE